MQQPPWFNRVHVARKHALTVVRCEMHGHLLKWIVGMLQPRSFSLVRVGTKAERITSLCKHSAMRQPQWFSLVPVACVREASTTA
jgi:hypothetical protein